MIKVLIADDQELIRESLKIVLGANEDMEVTGIAENGEEVLSQIKILVIFIRTLCYLLSNLI